MDSFAAMRVLVRTVETGSLSAAGRALGLAPSSVSRRIGELEASLGVTLLQRTTRKLRLTEAGETYFERAREIVRAVEEANLAVTGKRAGPTGTLRVSVAASISRQHLAAAVAAFQQRHPAIRVVMSVTDRMVDLVGEGFDVAIRLGRQEDSSLIARKLGESRRVVCASAAYLERAGRPRRPEDLSGHACLTFRSHAGSNLWRFEGDEGTATVRASGPFYSDDGATLVAAAAAGIGVILVPEWLVSAEIAAGRLVEVLDGFAPLPALAPLYAVHAPGAYTAPKIRAFIDFLAERFGRGYDWGGPAATRPGALRSSPD